MTAVERRVESGFARIALRAGGAARRRAPRAGARAAGAQLPPRRASPRRPKRRGGAGDAARDGRARRPRRDAEGAPMIMPRGSDQLLLPVNPLFICAARCWWRWRSTCCRWAGTPALPDLLALALVFWNVHQPRRVGVGVGLRLRPADGRAPGRAARPARAGLHAAELRGHHACTGGCCGSASSSRRCRSLPLFLAAHAACRWSVRMVGRRHVPGLVAAARAGGRGAAVAAGHAGCCWRRSAGAPDPDRESARCDRRRSTCRPPADRAARTSNARSDRFRGRLLAAAAVRAARLRRCWRRAWSTCRWSSHEELATQAEANRIAVVPVVPNRGLIVDRNGVVLATNYSAYTLEITPSRMAATPSSTR
ncbi:MAG: hypothetical protein MZW92_14050 [Comamonadaceae bacterium]|nr:hypothetical protein [Comamonadaceae bacterium]